MALLLISCSASAKGEAVTCPADLKLIARELLELDLSGLRLREKSSCLDQARFKHVRVFHDPAGEESQPDPKLIQEDAVVTIDQVVENAEAQEQQAFFTVVPARGAGSVSGSFRFVVHKSELRRRRDGCAELLSFPETWMVRSRCKKS